MKIVRYYYSEALYSVSAEVIVDGCGEYVMENSGCLCSLKKVPLPRKTVCGIYDTETGIMTFGVATCSPTDIFEKKVGRELAQKRANDNPTCTVRCNKSKKMPSLFYEMASDLANY